MEDNLQDNGATNLQMEDNGMTNLQMEDNLQDKGATTTNQVDKKVNLTSKATVLEELQVMKICKVDLVQQVSKHI